MRKLLGTLLVFAAMFMLASCGGGNTPKSVAEKAYKALQEEKYDKFVDNMYFKADKGSDIDEQKKQMAALLKEKFDKKKDDSIKSFEALSEEIDENGEKAVVKMKVVYENGKEDTSDVKLRKDEDGNWKVDIGK